MHEGDDNAGVELKRNKNSTTAEGSNTDKNPWEKDAEKMSSNEEDEDKVDSNQFRFHNTATATIACINDGSSLIELARSGVRCARETAKLSK